ncbi:signal peptidase I [Staphylococcus chromogenes]|uniref:signal peptidase I n=1 Tax=Staphylococcus chromogenes TaxID=46126 RepID=UPI0010AD514C|nr:signal peptidase I [Staphylococcus chromogenes]TJY15533.1 signal peptidase I [Staphylococcus chromogenes]
MRKTIKIMGALISAIIVLLVIVLFIAVPFRADNDYMSPLIQKGDRMIVNQLTPRLNMIHHADMIVYHKDGQLHLGRIIGEPGQSIEIKAQQLYVDNQPVKDDWVKQIGVQNWSSKMLSEQESDIISPSHYVVMNQLSSSKESEAFGTVHKNDIIGRILIRYYPFEKMTVNFKD